MRAAVRNVAKYFPTAIVSGRSRKKVLMKRLHCCFFFFAHLYVYMYCCMNLDTLTVCKLSDVTSVS